jgi:hypothetical protein
MLSNSIIDAATMTTPLRKGSCNELSVMRKVDNQREADAGHGYLGHNSRIS